jgi:hypothetical protein
MDLESLQSLYRSNPEVIAICDALGNRQNNQLETKLKSLFASLNANNTTVQQWKLIRAFRELEKLGCGQYVEGRHGHPSRFVWNPEFGSLSICRAAFGESLVSTETDAENPDLGTFDRGTDEKNSQLLSHYFNLRADYEIEFTLPIDLTKTEAERLAAFVRSLPLEDFQ